MTNEELQQAWSVVMPSISDNNLNEQLMFIFAEMVARHIPSTLPVDVQAAYYLRAIQTYNTTLTDLIKRDTNDSIKIQPRESE